MTKALITGITGQDGSYLTELLLSKGYEVFGLMHETSISIGVSNISHLLNDIHLLYGDLQDFDSICKTIKEVEPDEIYNLGAQSFVKESFRSPIATGNITALGVTRMLEAIRQIDPSIKFYQASSSEMFGKVKESPQNEETPFYPRSPYGVAKVYGYWITRNYREAYNIFACNGILFNHESPRRGLEFVSRKITNAAARIKLKKQKELRLGNLEAKRDWGYAKEYVEAMWLMLQQKKPDDFVIATGETHSVKEFAELAFNYVGLNYEDYVKIDESLRRPSEVDLLVGDASKAKKILKWQPKTTFKQLVELMVKADLEFEKVQK